MSLFTVLFCVLMQKQKSPQKIQLEQSESFKSSDNTQHNTACHRYNVQTKLDHRDKFSSLHFTVFSLTFHCLEPLALSAFGFSYSHWQSYSRKEVNMKNHSEDSSNNWTNNWMVNAFICNLLVLYNTQLLPWILMEWTMHMQLTQSGDWDDVKVWTSTSVLASMTRISWYSPQHRSQPSPVIRNEQW